MSMPLDRSHEPWLARVSEYLDGEMPPRARRAVEAHLVGCDQCAAAADELRRLKAEAPQMLSESEPGSDLWPGIHARLQPRRRHWSPIRLAWLAAVPPRLAVAAGVTVALALAVALATWSARTPVQPRTEAKSAAMPRKSAPVTSDPAYTETVAALEREARARLSRDPRLVEILEENLASIDVAIANYRDALSSGAHDPGMQRRLDTARQRKLDVLQQAVTLAEGAN